jgi:hypothetical protein
MQAESIKLGGGSHVYEVVDNWAKLPDSVKTGNCHGVVTDKQDRVYIFNASKDAMLVFDREGNLLESRGEEFAGGAHGLMINDEGGEEFLYLTDYELQTIVKTTLEGKEVMRIGLPEHQPTRDEVEKYKPTWTDIGPNGDIYVTDGYGLAYVHQFEPNGRYNRTWGGPGEGEGQFKCPHGISVIETDGEHEVYVADRGNIRLQVFTLDGQFKRMVTEELRHPDVVIEKDGFRYIPDLYCRITIFDKHDKLVCHFGDYLEAKDMEGWPDIPMDKRIVGKFSSPHGIWPDAHDDLYIVEWIPQGRITKLQRCK